MSFTEKFTSHLDKQNNEAIPSGWDNMEIKETESTKEILKSPVYYVESPDDSTVLVAMDVTIEHNKYEDHISSVSWYDTTRERNMFASETAKDGDDFSFKRIKEEGGGTYRFTPMNLDIYYSKVKKHLLSGADFDNDEDLIKAFLTTKEESW